MSTIRLAIAGVAGRMGQALVRAALAQDGFTITGAAERAGAAATGQDIGALVGLAPLGVTVAADVATAARDADVWIDFSTPAATRAAMAALPAAGVRAAVIGTTGMDAAGEAAIAEAARTIAIVQSGNFSLGVNVLAALVRQAAQRLGADWDIEIVESHHRRKVDAPSGTALMLGEAAAAGRGRALRDLRLPPREGVTGARPEGGIGFAVVRAGGIVGEHEVILASETETLRLAHHAADRAIFATGALHAARWAADRGPGLYAMADVLGL
ncbi:MAG: 4-hydroxy-tetrahydrodipicolinate reductase [Hyphomonadaceae bacterium]|nr:4-hydroxy-tetrahydrodipicolinate reductase [Hyphomonadaceae bacterium]